MEFSALEYFALVVLALTISKIVWNIGRFLYTTFIGHFLGLTLDLRNYGPWAVVTGGTDGIGKAYALKLASFGLNIVLISRSPSKLQATAQEIREINPFIQVRTVAVDFTKDKSLYKEIALAISDLDVGVLINNVGLCVGFCHPFSDIGDEHILDDVINCNVVSMARMTHLILPQMLRRKHGLILNIGSLAGAFPTPLATIYGATKAFVDKFSKDLATELRSTGITVQTVLPGFVLTNMSMTSTSLNKSSWTVPNPSDYVDANIRTLGLESRTASFWYHKVALYVCEVSSFFLPSIYNVIAVKCLASLRRN